MSVANSAVFQKKSESMFTLPSIDRRDDNLHVLLQSVQQLQREAQCKIQLYFSIIEQKSHATAGYSGIEEGDCESQRHTSEAARAQAIISLNRAVDCAREIRTFCFDESNSELKSNKRFCGNNVDDSFDFLVRKGAATLRMLRPPLEVANILTLLRKTHVMLREVLVWGGTDSQTSEEAIQRNYILAIDHAERAYEITVQLAYVVQAAKTTLPLTNVSGKNADEIRCLLAEFEKECTLLEFAKNEMQIAVLRGLMGHHEKAVKNHRAAIKMISAFLADQQKFKESDAETVTEANQLFAVVTYNLGCDIEQVALVEVNSEKKQALLQEAHMLFGSASELGQRFLGADHPLFQQLQQAGHQLDQHYHHYNSQNNRENARVKENFNVFSTKAAPMLPQLPPLRNAPALWRRHNGSPNNLSKVNFFSTDHLGNAQKSAGNLDSLLSSSKVVQEASSLSVSPRRKPYCGDLKRKQVQGNEKGSMGLSKLGREAASRKKRQKDFDPTILHCHRLRRPSDALRLGGIVVEDALFCSRKAEAEAEKRRQEEIKKQKKRKRRVRSFLPEDWNTKDDAPVVRKGKKKEKSKKNLADIDKEGDGEKTHENCVNGLRASDIIKSKRLLGGVQSSVDIDISSIEEKAKRDSHVDIEGISLQKKKKKLDKEALINAFSKTSFTAADLQKLTDLDLKALNAVINAGGNDEEESALSDASLLTDTSQTRITKNPLVDLRALAALISGNAGTDSTNEDGNGFSISSPLEEQKQSEVQCKPNIDINRLITIFCSKQKDGTSLSAESLARLVSTKSPIESWSATSSASDRILTMDSAHFGELGEFALKNRSAMETELKEIQKENLEEKEEEEEEEEEEETEDDDEAETKEEAKERCEIELINYFNVVYFRRMKEACRIQCAWRCNRARLALHKRQQVLYREVYCRQKGAAMCIEGFFCSIIEKRRLQKKKELCLVALNERIEWERKLILSALIIARNAAIFLRRRRKERELCKLLSLSNLEELKVRSVAATILARWWRIIPAQKAYWRQRTREVEEQRQKEESLRRQMHAATQIQRIFRGILGRKEVLALRNRLIEEHRSRQRCLNESIDLIRLCLQEYTQRRKRLEREEAQRVLQREEAAAVIQSGWKMALQRQMWYNTVQLFSRIVRAVLAIQRAYRRYLAGREIRYLRWVHIAMTRERLDNEYRVFRATMTLQSFARVVVAKRRARQRRAAVGRGYFFAAMTIQSLCRGGVARARLGCLLHLQRMASEQLQKHIKTQMKRLAAVIVAFFNFRKSCILVETSRCLRLTEKLFICRRVRYELKRDRSATIIQRAVRRWIKHRRHCEEKVRAQKLQLLVLSSVVYIQSHVRGFLARCRYRNFCRLVRRRAQQREMMEEVGLQIFVDEWRAAELQCDLERRQIATVEARRRELLEQRCRSALFATSNLDRETIKRGTVTGKSNKNDNIGIYDDGNGYKDNHYSCYLDTDDEIEELEKSLSTYDNIW